MKLAILGLDTASVASAWLQDVVPRQIGIIALPDLASSESTLKT